jgi:hypothetical protein
MVVDLIVLVAAFVATVLAVVFELRREAKAAAKKKEQEEMKRSAELADVTISDCHFGSQHSFETDAHGSWVGGIHYHGVNYSRPVQIRTGLDEVVRSSFLSNTHGRISGRTVKPFASSYGIADRPGLPYKKAENAVKHYSEDSAPFVSSTFVPVFIATEDPNLAITPSGFEGFGGGDSGGAGATSSWDAPSTPDTSSCVADSSPSTDFSSSCDTSSSFDSGSSGSFGGDF